MLTVSPRGAVCVQKAQTFPSLPSKVNRFSLWQKHNGLGLLECDQQIKEGQGGQVTGRLFLQGVVAFIREIRLFSGCPIKVEILPKQVGQTIQANLTPTAVSTAINAGTCPSSPLIGPVGLLPLLSPSLSARCSPVSPLGRSLLRERGGRCYYVSSYTDQFFPGGYKLVRTDP